MRFRDWAEIRRELKSVTAYLRDHPRIITIGGTALVYYGLKRSTKDLDFVFPSPGNAFGSQRR